MRRAWVWTVSRPRSRKAPTWRPITGSLRESQGPVIEPQAAEVGEAATTRTRTIRNHNGKRCPASLESLRRCPTAQPLRRRKRAFCSEPRAPPERSLNWAKKRIIAARNTTFEVLYSTGNTSKQILISWISTPFPFLGYMYIYLDRAPRFPGGLPGVDGVTHPAESPPADL